MHRTTLWRRRKRKFARHPRRSSPRRGRWLCDEPRKRTTLQFAALLIEDEMLGSGSVDYVKILRESSREKWERPGFREVLSEIERWPFDANLIAFATYKALRIGTRTRRRMSFPWTDAQMTRRLMKQY